MKSVFALFDNFEDLKTAIDRLLSRGFEEREMNLVAASGYADHVAPTPRSIQGAAKTDRIGDRTLHGLDHLLAGEQAVTLEDVGPVYAAGELASILLKSPHSRASAPGTLEETLYYLSLPAQTVGAYVSGVKRGGPLFWIRTEDSRSAEAALILDECNGSHVSGNLPAVAVR